MHCPAHETVPVSLSSFSFSSRQPQALHVLHRGLLQVRSSLESVGFMRVSTGVDQNNSHADTQTHSQTHTHRHTHTHLSNPIHIHSTLKCQETRGEKRKGEARREERGKLAKRGEER